MPHESIHDRARGRWRDILPMIGISLDYLSGKHGPCPFCAGKDRFRFDDKAGNGSYFCSHCGAGSGVDLVMNFMKCDFLTAKKEIEKYIGGAKVYVHKASDSKDEISERLKATWMRSVKLNGVDPASRYLRNRGISFTDWPTQIRFLPDAIYKHDDGSKTRHPAMLAKFVSPDAKSFTLHTTYLTETGQKASVPKQKQNAAGKIPQGGAVRLSGSAETMGIAEGIETALSASILFQVPVWAALNAGMMQKWQPPTTAQSIIIFGDNDRNAAGQSAAWALCYRLRMEGVNAEVRLPDFEGDDWNDALLAEGRGRAA